MIEHPYVKIEIVYTILLMKSDTGLQIGVGAILDWAWTGLIVDAVHKCSPVSGSQIQAVSTEYNV